MRAKVLRLSLLLLFCNLNLIRADGPSADGACVLIQRDTSDDALPNPTEAPTTLSTVILPTIIEEATAASVADDTAPLATPASTAPIVPVPAEAQQYTHSLISDFTTQKLDPTDWTVEVYDISAAKDQQSPYGRSVSAANVVSNPGTEPDSGLQLWVRSALGQDNTLVGTSEINSVRRDILYGTFRVGMKIPSTLGTCAAFFWYRNDTQEIDLEFLPRQVNQPDHAMDYVLHYSPSIVGNPAPAPASPGVTVNSPSFQTVSLPVDPTTGVHEYRFDWTPTAINFFFDGALLASYTDPAVIPSSPGLLAFNHWSNGNQWWTQGPPTQDSSFLITYAHAWFNVSG